MRRNSVSLREHYDALWLERQARLDERWKAQQEAVDRAQEELSKRLDLLNELRENILTRDEYDAKHQVLTVALQRNSEQLTALSGQRQGFLEFRTGLIATLVVLVGIAALISPHIH